MRYDQKTFTRAVQSRDAYLKVFGTSTTNVKTKGEDHARESQEHFSGSIPQDTKNDAENNKIETSIW